MQSTKEEHLSGSYRFGDFPDHVSGHYGRLLGDSPAAKNEDGLAKAAESDINTT